MGGLETRLLIGGENVAGDGAEIEVESPYSEEIIARVRAPSREQLDAAIAAAHEAQRGWERTPALERAELLHELATRLRERTDELAEAFQETKHVHIDTEIEAKDWWYPYGN